MLKKKSQQTNKQRVVFCVQVSEVCPTGTEIVP
jgi:hypothetical protein